MRARIFHLSDLHLRSGWHEAQGSVLHGFHKDVAQYIDPSVNNILVFSGDLVQSGQDSALYAEFSDKFGELFSLFPDKQKRVCCPGNHDVDRSYIEKNTVLLEAIAGKSLSEAIFNNSIHGQLKDSIQPKFTVFDDFQKSHFGVIASGDNFCGDHSNIGEIGFYVLNSALFSFGGAKSSSDGEPINDYRKLPVETRKLAHWLQTDSSTFRVLVLHHPLDWLDPTFSVELQAYIRNGFDLVLSGHLHEANLESVTSQLGSAIFLSAPALFEHKHFPNGYAFCDIDTDEGTASVTYREWSPKNLRFVLGTQITGSDTGKVDFPIRGRSPQSLSLPAAFDAPDRVEPFLKAQFDAALHAYRSLNNGWISPRLSKTPEYESRTLGPESLSAVDALSSSDRTAVIAPPRFGLTTLGKHLALEWWRANSELIKYTKLQDAPQFEKELVSDIGSTTDELGVGAHAFRGYIIDCDRLDKYRISRFLKAVAKVDPTLSVMLLLTQKSVADSNNDLISKELGEKFTQFYMVSLTRAEIRLLVRSQIAMGLVVDEDALTDRVVTDIDNINAHRTALHVKILLSIASRHFDISPLNMTEVHSMQLLASFLNNMPALGYDTVPDVKDSCYALGYFCASLVRSGTSIFEKNDFLLQTSLYCDEKSIDLDIARLFECLTTEKIIIPIGSSYKFHYMYWVYFFGAHHMIANKEFADYILDNMNYAKYEEMVEYYSGIDRRRTDLIDLMYRDLEILNSSFKQRSGIQGDSTVYETITWEPNIKEIDSVNETIDDLIDNSALPVLARDAMADKSFDPQRPYTQELRNFIAELSLGTTTHIMVAGARALRNSDHVDADGKIKLLREVLLVWKELIQASLIVSPVLTRDKAAAFEDVVFVLSGFDGLSPEEAFKTTSDHAFVPLQVFF